ncbi:Flp family type IVb pilin [bacterium]|nr:Flp family type IVb pilin [bacterium]
MRTLGDSVRRFLLSEDGPTSVEYAVMMMVIFLIVIGAIGSVGQTTAAIFQNNANRLPPP